MARYVGYKRPENIKETLKRLLHYMEHHKLSLAVVAVFVIISSFANIMGTYLLKPVINTYIIPGNRKGLFYMVGAMGVMYVIGAISTLLYNKLMVKTSQKMVSEIRKDLFVHTQTLPLSYFDTNTHGNIMSHFTNDIDTVAEALNNSFTMIIQSFIVMSGTIIAIVVLNIRLSMVVLFSLALMFLFIQYNGKKSKKYFGKQQKYMGELNGFMEEMIDGQKVEKVFNHEEKDFEQFCIKNEKLRNASTKALTYSGVMIPTVVSISYVNYAVSACIGALFTLSGLMDIGSLASYLVYVRQSAMPVNQFTQQINFILAALSGAERIFKMMDLESELDEGSVTLTNVSFGENGIRKPCEEYTGHWAWNQSGKLIPLKGEVRFHQVKFGYQEDKIILDNISLYAKPGQKIALVGSTGAGKTTIINLINRFYEVSDGKITYDGIDIRDIKKEDLRRSLSFVLQDTHLFTGTIRDNIRYGRLNASKEEIKEAAKLANADSFIRRLPEGYDTEIKGDGVNLSQGQRQLLAIARAAIANPPVLILDEATSSIDTRTERLIEKGMDSLMENRTVFVIAHRLSTVRNSKAIIVLENGGVVERGSHEELIEEKGRYYKLYTGQFELS